VHRSQRIGYVGNTGRSTAAHLHWEQIRAGVRQELLYGHGRALAPARFHVSRNCIDPIGRFDALDSPDAGHIRVRGWAFDPSRPRRAIGLTATVGGTMRQGGARHPLGSATRHREDVAAFFPDAGPAHGFEVTVPIDQVGQRRVCVYAHNIGHGRDVRLRCRRIRVLDPDPVGAVEVVDAPAPGQVFVRGWAMDHSDPSVALTVLVTVGSDEPVGVAADQPDHVFEATLATEQVGSQEVCLHADNVGHGADRLLGCETVTLG
jgi:hypothetical protein